MSMLYPEPPVEEPGPAGGLDCDECGHTYEQNVLRFWDVDEVTTTWDCPTCHHTNEMHMSRRDAEFEG